jgi:nucleoside-diphosphate-sugar epimerase
VSAFPPRALVTGGSGFLGGRLAQLLAARDVTVRALVRDGSDTRHLGDSRIELVRGSLTDGESLAAAVRGVTHVYHCAACSTDWAPWRVYYDANVAGVRNLLEAAAREPGLERFLHVSTTDVYGYPRVPCSESGPLVDVGLPYNRTKLLGENLVRDASLPWTILRPATIHGPRGKAFAIDIAALLRQGLMAVIDGGRAPGGFSYVDNVAEAIIAAGASPNTVGRVYNIADGSGATWRTYVDALADGLGLRRPWLSMPSSAAFELARAMEAAHRFLRLPGRPLLTRHAVYLLARDQEFPTEAARRDFGFQPAVSFEEGVERTVAWLRE